jgi:DNA-binding beta-propeller fold protein YncE
MKTKIALSVIALVCTGGLRAQQNEALRLIRTIVLPGVSGRFDHSTVDLDGQRLFITGRDANTVEVVDLRTSRHARSLSGFPQPQGAYYVPSVKKLFVSTRDDGSCKVLDGKSLDVISSIKLSIGANVIAYDPQTTYLYIGHGGKQVGDTPGQKRDPGQIAIIDSRTTTLIGNIETDPELRPGAIVLDQHGPRLFTTNALGSQIIIVDRKRQKVVAKWPLPNAERSGTVALDETRHRLFVGMRNPSRVIVLDSDTGKQITSFTTVSGIDRLLYDPDKKRIYASGSAKTGEHEGSIQAYRQVDADHYELIAKIPTGPDGGTSLLVQQTGTFYVALPRFSDKDAEIRVYSTSADAGNIATGMKSPKPSK